jgi:hypothetical protein
MVVVALGFVEPGQLEEHGGTPEVIAERAGKTFAGCTFTSAHTLNP